MKGLVIIFHYFTSHLRRCAICNISNSQCNMELSHKYLFCLPMGWSSSLFMIQREANCMINSWDVLNNLGAYRKMRTQCTMLNIQVVRKYRNIINLSKWHHENYFLITSTNIASSTVIAKWFWCTVSENITNVIEKLDKEWIVCSCKLN